MNSVSVHDNHPFSPNHAEGGQRQRYGRTAESLRQAKIFRDELAEKIRVEELSAEIQGCECYKCNRKKDWVWFIDSTAKFICFNCLVDPGCNPAIRREVGL